MRYIRGAKKEKKIYKNYFGGGVGGESHSYLIPSDYQIGEEDEIIYEFNQDMEDGEE